MMCKTSLDITMKASSVVGSNKIFLKNGLTIRKYFPAPVNTTSILFILMAFIGLLLKSFPKFAFGSGIFAEGTRITRFYFTPVIPGCLMYKTVNSLSIARKTCHNWSAEGFLLIILSQSTVYK